MSLEEKIGQTSLRGTSSRVKGALPEELKEAVRKGKIGAFLNVMNPDYVDELQRLAVEESPYGIPLIFSRDVIHGFKTIFPIPLGIAATWDPEVAKISSRIAAIEASSVGIRWTFAPMLDISRDSRWGRVAESPGEDPYLGALLAKGYVEGFQGEDLKDPTSMAACIKHFIGYGAAIGGRDYNTVIIHEPLLRNVYLPPFQAAVDAGALTVMTAFNELNGIPASGSEFLLKDLLRDQMGFDGFVVSDWNSITEMIPHGFARDKKHATQLAAHAGLDMEMTSTSYEDNLISLIKEGIIPETQLDFLVQNILRAKFKLGLFENPMRPQNEASPFYKTDHLDAAKQAASRSMVLLKNKDILPLNKSKKIAVIGPLSDAPHEQLGTWTFDGEKEKTITPVDAMRQLGMDFDYIDGLTYSRDTSVQFFDKAIEIVNQADVVLFMGGEEAILSGEAHSRANIDLPGRQEDLIKKVAATGKPVILVIMAGRPITITNIIDDVDAVLMAWHPGTMGGPALLEVLTGEVEPGGRLPISWPKTAGQLPFFYNHKNTGRPANKSNFIHMNDIPIGAWQSSLGNNSHYLDAGFEPHFPFGYGLTYTDFSYSDLGLSSTSIQKTGTIELEVNVTNTGSREGTEIVQVYVQDVTGSITRPVKELKAFLNTNLKPGESKTVLFNLPAKDLSFFNHNNEEVLESGIFNVWVGPNAATGLKSTFELID